ncbi:TM0106 family RecB-like putative nuclease [Laspinema olomoucense]|uniref:TM0106 family RecB-like putative nuclease n=1 Tax=Laspinema olomoucense TaxID=3231600 RepID=UPI0021BAF22A|nr:TM0106 family RecB-like putative nuclease [Laspinema sp. D3d]MCT7974342.1 TM0106 family RecB-like putative nuclease [Laspinema sp. D3d]
MLLTDDLLFDYQRCARLSFLNLYGNGAHPEPPSDFATKLKRDSEVYRHNVLAEYPAQRPSYPYGDWAKGAEATVALMKQGVDRIDHGVLMTSGPQGVTLMSRPDLLIKKPGASVYGNWSYIPVDIRFSKRPKAQHQVMAAFHALVLAGVQGAWPRDAWLVCREKGEYWVNLEKYVPQMQKVLDPCIKMLTDRQEPEVFMARHPCSMCQWQSRCYAIAQQTQHLSLLPGVTPIRYQQLKQLNLTQLESLAHADVLTLANGLVEICNNQYEPETVARDLIIQAKATLNNQPIALPKKLPLSPKFLPVSPVELYFDIEAQPELDLDFLLGVLVVDRRNLAPGEAPTQKFYAFLAESPDEEGQIWEQFLELIWTYPIAPIFHFCDYEIQTLKKLARRYHTPPHRWKVILNRFVDIHKLVTQSVVMPVESYALKSIARYLGFEWHEASASGAQCVVWYDRWLETGDRNYLDLILTYNEDDCIATFVVKEWLVNFSQKFPSF